MILTAKKGSEFEQTLRELYDQHLRNKKEAIEVLTDYYGVKPVEMLTSWCLGNSCMFSPLDMTPEHMPETLKKGVRRTSDGLLTVDRRTKEGGNSSKNGRSSPAPEVSLGRALSNSGSTLWILTPGATQPGTCARTKMTCTA